ncbi:MAG: hypothetical protein H6574_10325 [Lewinellaceae bacterium]|nr:hypothetical protein [Lewinellaceae bacterium]
MKKYSLCNHSSSAGNFTPPGLILTCVKQFSAANNKSAKAISGFTAIDTAHPIQVKRSASISWKTIFAKVLCRLGWKLAAENKGVAVFSTDKINPYNSKSARSRPAPLTRARFLLGTTVDFTLN